MWTVVKYKIHEINLLKDGLKKLLESEPTYYQPKIKIQKFINNKLKTYEKPILENYLIFYHSKLKANFFANKLKYIKGILKILSLSTINQKEIINFISRCKEFENKDGYLLQEFFEHSKTSKAKFVTGPFSNLFFKIVSKQKKKFNLLMGNIKVSVKRKESDCFFQSV